VSLRDFKYFGEKPIIGRLNVNGLLALAGIIGPIVLLITDLIAARSAAVNHYSLVRDSISLLAWMPMGWIQTIGFLTIGLLVEIFAAGLFLNLRSAKGFGFGILLLVLSGFGLLMIGAFHTDIPGREDTIDGLIHGLAAKTVFWLLPVANLLITPSLKNDPRWRALFSYSVAIASFALVWMIIYQVWLSENLTWFGLYERILVVSEVLWVELMAIWSLRLSLRGQGKRHLEHS
jgi:hypothetical protein